MPRLTVRHTLSHEGHATTGAALRGFYFLTYGTVCFNRTHYRRSHSLCCLAHSESFKKRGQPVLRMPDKGRLRQKKQEKPHIE